MTSYSKKFQRVLNALAESEQLYKTASESTDDAFQIIEILYDTNGKPTDGIYRKINKRAEMLFNLNAYKCIGKRVREVCPSIEDYWFLDWDQVIKTGKPSRLQNYYTRTDTWFDIFSFPYGVCLVGILYRDITDSKAGTGQEVQSINDRNQRINL